MIFSEFKRIKVVALDVDGVLTDGTIQMTEDGKQLRTFQVKDGYAMQLAEKRGIPIWIISGGQSEGVRMRMQGLGIKEIYLGASNKLATLQDLLNKYNLAFEDVLFIGDDIPDLEVMKKVGLAVCPNDAVEEIKAISHYMSPRNGGHAVVREILERLLKVQGKWDQSSEIKSI